MFLVGSIASAFAPLHHRIIVRFCLLERTWFSNHFCLMAIAAASEGVTAEEEAVTAAGVVQDTDALLEDTGPPLLPFVVPLEPDPAADDFLLLLVWSPCNFFVEAAEDVFRLLEERLDSVVELGTAFVSPLLPLEQAMEGGEEGVALGVDEPVELIQSLLLP